MKLKDIVYKYITKWYIKLSNKQHFNMEPLEGDEYTKEITKLFRGCNYSVTNPIECIYFSLIEVYREIEFLQIMGVSVDYEEDIIKVNIITKRPGIIIGFRGRDIDQLTDKLTEYFGKKTIINLIESKVQFVSSDW